MCEVEGGRELTKVPQYGKELLGEQPLRSNRVGGGCGRELPKVPLYGKWLIGEKPLCSLCVGGGWCERIPQGPTVWEVVISGETSVWEVDVGENSLRSHSMGSGY